MKIKPPTKTERLAEARKVFDEAIKPAQLIYNDSTKDAFRVIQEAKQVLYDTNRLHLDAFMATRDLIEIEMPRKLSADQKQWQKSNDERTARQKAEKKL